MAAAVDLDSGFRAQRIARESIGFDSSDAHIRGLMADAQASARGLAYGFASTPAEHDEMMIRLRMQAENQTTISRAMRDYPDTYAASWIDHHRGGLQVVSFLGVDPVAAGVIAHGLRSTFPFPDRLVVQSAAYREEDLMEMQKIIDDYRFQVAGAVLTGSVVLVQADRLDVYYTGAVDAAQTVVKSLGIDLDAVRFVRDAGLEGGEQSPVRGGDAMQACSAGAWAYIWWNGLQVPYQITAGHCSPPDHLYHSEGGWHNPAMNVVPGHVINGGSVDAQAMSTTDWTMATTQVTNRNDPNNPVLTITAATGANQIFDRVGDWVCRTGLATSRSCGQIHSRNYSCREHSGMRAAWYDSDLGDSGGTVFGEFVFTTNVSLSGLNEGIASCTSPDLKMYTWQENARFTLGMQGWFTS